RLNNGVFSIPVYAGAIEYGTNTYNDGNWHFLVVQLPTINTSTSNVEVFIDGVQLSITSDPSITLNIYSSFFIVGADQAGANNFDGEIDEVNIVEGNYTQTEVDTLYNSGNGITI
ncbi:LamG-like jellyroll fold domain-containing protein, partial [Seonamhaeicola sp.]|uniref:LamG-like jellyroll fold domain-containing protein n=1 Tax=Seonamhaeicola sp. TaxID=1912245 RepID=UPI00356524E0